MMYSPSGWVVRNPSLQRKARLWWEMRQYYLSYPFKILYGKAGFDSLTWSCRSDITLLQTVVEVPPLREAAT